METTPFFAVFSVGPCLFGRIKIEVGLLVWWKTNGFIVLFGPTLAAMCTSVCCFKNSQKMQALQRSLFDSGEIGGDFTYPQPRYPQPRFQAVGLAIHKRETWKYACIYLRDFDITPTDVGVVDTCPGDTLVSDTLVS